MHLNRNGLCAAAGLLAALLLCGCNSAPQAVEVPETIAVTEYPAESAVPPEPDAETAPEETAVLPVEVEAAAAPKAPWYTSDRLIYHACGGIDGISYTNAKEALELTLSNGKMLVEVDFLFTEDGHLICGHKWNDIIPVEEDKKTKKNKKKTEETLPEVKCTLDVFRTLKIKGNYTGLTASDIISYMQEYPDLYIIVDTKEENLTGVVGELLRLCDHQQSVADRFVIQLYDQGQKEKLRELYPFRDDNFLFTCYKFDPLRVEEILALCDAEQIDVVTVSYGSWEAETVNLFLERGILLFEHTVNLPEMVQLSLEKGIYGFYTDFLQNLNEMP